MWTNPGSTVQNWAAWYPPISTDYNGRYNVRIWNDCDPHFRNHDVRYQRWANGTAGGVTEVWRFDQGGSPCDSIQHVGQGQFYGSNGGYVRLVDRSSDTTRPIGVDHLRYVPVPHEGAGVRSMAVTTDEHRSRAQGGGPAGWRRAAGAVVAAGLGLVLGTALPAGGSSGPDVVDENVHLRDPVAVLKAGEPVTPYGIRLPTHLPAGAKLENADRGVEPDQVYLGAWYRLASGGGLHVWETNHPTASTWVQADETLNDRRGSLEARPGVAGWDHRGARAQHHVPRRRHHRDRGRGGGTRPRHPGSGRGVGRGGRAAPLIHRARHGSSSAS